jgi:hypothetical protein
LELNEQTGLYANEIKRLRGWDIITALKITTLRYYGKIIALWQSYGIKARLQHYEKSHNCNAFCHNITTSANQLRLTSLVIFSCIVWGSICILTVLADGIKLLPIVIFEGKQMLKNLPSEIIALMHPKGWMNESEMKIWFNKIWKKKLENKRKSLFIIDNFKTQVK